MSCNCKNKIKENIEIFLDEFFIDESEDIIIIRNESEDIIIIKTLNGTIEVKYEDLTDIEFFEDSLKIEIEKERHLIPYKSVASIGVVKPFKRKFRGLNDKIKELWD